MRVAFATRDLAGAEAHLGWTAPLAVHEVELLAVSAAPEPWLGRKLALAVEPAAVSPAGGGEP